MSGLLHHLHRAASPVVAAGLAGILMTWYHFSAPWLSSGIHGFVMVGTGCMAGFLAGSVIACWILPLNTGRSRLIVLVLAAAAAAWSFPAISRTIDSAHAVMPDSLTLALSLFPVFLLAAMGLQTRAFQKPGSTNGVSRASGLAGTCYGAGAGAFIEAVTFPILGPEFTLLIFILFLPAGGVIFLIPFRHDAPAGTRPQACPLSQWRAFFSLFVIALSASALLYSARIFLHHHLVETPWSLPLLCTIWFLTLGAGMTAWNRWISPRWPEGLTGLHLLVIINAFAVQLTIFCLKQSAALEGHMSLLAGAGKFRALILFCMVSFVCLTPTAISLGSIISWLASSMHQLRPASSRTAVWVPIAAAVFLALPVCGLIIVSLVGVSWLLAAIPQAFLAIIPKVTRTWVVAALAVNGFSGIFLLALQPEPDADAVVETPTGIYSVQTVGDSRTQVSWDSRRNLSGMLPPAAFLGPMIWAWPQERGLFLGDYLNVAGKIASLSDGGEHENIGVELVRQTTLGNQAMLRQLRNVAQSTANDFSSPAVVHTPAAPGFILQKSVPDRSLMDLIVIWTGHPMPWQESSLLESRFLGLARRALSDQGWLALWVPVSDMDMISLKKVGRMVAEKFEQVHVFLITDAMNHIHAGFFAGTEESPLPDIESISARYKRLQEHQPDDFNSSGGADLFGGYLGDRDWLLSVSGVDPAHPENRLPTAFSLPISYPMSTSTFINWACQDWKSQLDQFPLPFLHSDDSAQTSELRQIRNRRKAWFLYLSGLRNLTRAQNYQSLLSLYTAAVMDPDFAPVMEALRNPDPALLRTDSALINAVEDFLQRHSSSSQE
jgi:hypothetical protein